MAEDQTDSAAVQCFAEAEKWQSRGNAAIGMANEGHRRFLVPGDADESIPMPDIDATKIRVLYRQVANQAYLIAGHYRRMAGEAIEDGDQ